MRCIAGLVLQRISYGKNKELYYYKGLHGQVMASLCFKEIPHPGNHLRVCHMT
jgi:hypothetical protein